MLSDLESFYFNRPADEQELLLYLRRFILDASDDLTEHYKFKTAFFYFKGKMFCYFGQEKKSGQIYIGFVMGKHLRHHALMKGQRKQIKILPIPGNEDLNTALLCDVLREALEYCAIV